MSEDAAAGREGAPEGGDHAAAGREGPGLTAPELNVHRRGSGPPMLLMHGVGHRWQAFTPVIGRLAAGGYEVIAIDLPGFGRSAPLAGVKPSIPAYAEAIRSWIQAQDLGRPVVVGNSMGGAIALELARGGAASQAIAISPAGFWTDGERRYCQIMLKVIERIPRRLRPAVLKLLDSPGGRRALLSHLFARPARMPAAEARATLTDAWRSPILAQALTAFDSYRFDPADGPIEVPVTVLWGSRDLLLPFALQAPRARRELPDARHVTLPRLGHVPFWDDPGMVAQVMLGVLSADAAQSRPVESSPR